MAEKEKAAVSALGMAGGMEGVPHEGNEGAGASPDEESWMSRYYHQNGDGTMKPLFLKYDRGCNKVTGIDHGLLARFLCESPFTACCKIGGTMSIRSGERYNISPDEIRRRIIGLTEEGYRYTRLVTNAEGVVVEEIPMHLRYSTTISDRREVFDYLHNIMEDYKPAPAKYIVFDNGVVDVEKYMDGDDGYFSEEIPPDIRVTNVIPHSFVPDAAPVEIVDVMLDNISSGKKNVADSIVESWGHCLYRDKSIFENMPTFYGEGGGGKSTNFEFLTFMLGEENVSFVKLQDFSKTYSSVHTIAGKLANIDDDVSSEFVPGKTWSLAKTMSSGKSTHCDVKYDPNGVDFKNTATLLMATNSIFSTSSRDADRAVQDRIAWIPVNARIRGTDKQDPNFKKKLYTEEAAEYALRMALDGLVRLLRSNGRFSVADEAEEVQRQFVLDNDPFEAWLDDTGYDAARFWTWHPDAPVGAGEGDTMEDTKTHAKWHCSVRPYDEYVAWCKSHGRPGHGSENKFSRRVQARFELDRGEYTWSATLSKTWRPYVTTARTPESEGVKVTKAKGGYYVMKSNPKVAEGGWYGPDDEEVL